MDRISKGDWYFKEKSGKVVTSPTLLRDPYPQLHTGRNSPHGLDVYLGLAGANVENKNG